MEKVRVNIEKREPKSYDILIGSDFIKMNYLLPIITLPAM